MCSSAASSDKEKGLRRQLDETGVCRVGEAIVFADTEEDLSGGERVLRAPGAEGTLGEEERTEMREFPGEPTSHLVQHQHLEAAGLAERVTLPTVMNDGGVHVG